ncbi:MAG TPA: universal stress protein [Jatrophihabitans sp.]|jgi:hypothetical protein|nr:universal stress protein [Jatrophihabitans sp.]
MTTVHPSPEVAAAHPARPRLRHRLIGVGFRDAERDRATIEWAVHDAVAGGDPLHLVHAYVPLRLDGCWWEPVTQARDARYLAARRVVAKGQQLVAATAANVRCGGSTIAGLPQDVFVELSDIVDVIVIGDDSRAGGRGITWRIQDTARCAVVCVPPTYTGLPDPRPVTLVVDDQGISESALQFGAEHARRHGVTLEVSRSWSSLHDGPVDGPAWVAEQQEELDAQLALWSDRHALPPIVARIELDDDWLDSLRRGSSLLVAAGSAAPLLRTPPADPTAACPVAVVPER